jgi:hypothetical protein
MMMMMIIIIMMTMIIAATTNKTNSVAFSPKANSIDLSIAAGQQILCQLLRGQRHGPPRPPISVFQTGSAPHLSSRG